MILDTNALSDLADRNLTLAGIIDAADKPVLPIVAIAE